MSESTPEYPFPKRASIHQRRSQENTPEETPESSPVRRPVVRSSASTPGDSLQSSPVGARPRETEATTRAAQALPAHLPTRRSRRGAQEDTAVETTGMRSRRLEQERRLVRKRKRRRAIRTFFVLLLTLALISGGAYFAYTQLRGSSSSSTTADDYPGPGSGQVVVTVYDGESGQQIGQRLVDAGVVKSLTAFIRAFDANKAAVSIRPGSYTLKKEMSASGAIAALLDDANRSDNTVTVTPGQTKDQVAEQISMVANIPLDQVKSAMADTAALGLPAEANGNVEGWLAPGSYELAEGATATSLISQMITRTTQRLDGLGVAAADREKILTKASILEREVRNTEYLPMVSRVIDNRLADTNGETHGLLQMDSTVLYGVGKTGGIPTADDLAAENPYNTYRNPGLPPSPISQPSTEAIEAALHPAEGNWLYFVTVNLDTGETLFAATHDEQTQNTKRLEEYCSTHQGKC